jgi:hypothetical protein
MSWNEKQRKSRADKLRNDADYRERVNARRRKGAPAPRPTAGAGYALPLDAIPEAWHPHVVTTSVGPDGETIQQSIQARPDPNLPFQAVPEGFNLARISTLSNGDGKGLLQWSIANVERQKQWEAFWTAAAASAETYANRAEPVPVTPANYTDSLNFFPLGDPHIGLLAWAQETGADFDTRIAEREILGAISSLVSRVPYAYTALLCNLGDFYHAQDDKRETPTAGHKLDVDSRAGKVYAIGLNVMRSMVDALLQRHERVIVHNLPGNHDPRMAVMIAMWLEAWYRSEPRVTVMPADDPFQAHEHGETLLLMNHGDGVKPEDLAGVMAAHDGGRPWGRTTFRYGIQGHRHCSRKIEKPGALIEVFRTLAGKDFWTHWKGYRSGQSLDAITYSPKYGEIGRVTCDVTMAREAAARP